MYPEFVWLRLLEQAGWTGVWVKYWGGRAFWTNIHAPLEVPKAQADMFEAIEALTGTTKGGCWDIFAWHGDDVAFIESKQRGHDKIRPAQALWLEKSLSLGLDISSFLIAEYTIPKRGIRESLI